MIAHPVRRSRVVSSTTGLVPCPFKMQVNKFPSAPKTEMNRTKNEHSIRCLKRSLMQHALIRVFHEKVTFSSEMFVELRKERQKQR